MSESPWMQSDTSCDGKALGEITCKKIDYNRSNAPHIWSHTSNQILPCNLSVWFDSADSPWRLTLRDQTLVSYHLHFIATVFRSFSELRSICCSNGDCGKAIPTGAWNNCTVRVRFWDHDSDRNCILSTRWILVSSSSHSSQFRLSIRRHVCFLWCGSKSVLTFDVRRIRAV